MTGMEIGFMLLALLGGVCSWAIYLDASKGAKRAEEREANLMNRLVELGRDNDDLREYRHRAMLDFKELNQAYHTLEIQMFKYAAKCRAMEEHAKALAEASETEVEKFPLHTS